MPPTRLCSLVSLDNGRVSISGLTPGSTAQYMCNNGYIIVGSSIRTCLPSGAWSDTDPACYSGINCTKLL